MFAARRPGDELRHLPEEEMRGLGDDDARALLGSAVRFKLDERVLERIVAEMRGNPLALLELPRGLSATQLAGGFGLLGAQGLPGRIEEGFSRRLEALPEQACLMSLVAAAEPLGDPVLVEGESAEAFYCEAIERLGRTRIRVQLARAQLLYGEWLRRTNRRVDAREQLRAAHQLFTSSGMAAFDERARSELLATGETVRRTVETRDDLTPQERQIAQLARDGFSNPEIGSRLFLSPRTIEWHLRKVFGKLGIRSRRELSSALPRAKSELVSA